MSNHEILTSMHYKRFYKYQIVQLFYHNTCDHDDLVAINYIHEPRV